MKTALQVQVGKFENNLHVAYTHTTRLHMGKSSQRVCQVGDKGGRQGKQGKAIYCEKELFLVRLNWRQADVV